jgi:hypothetical protein
VVHYLERCHQVKCLIGLVKKQVPTLFLSHQDLELNTLLLQVVVAAVLVQVVAVVLVAIVI